MLYKTLIKTTLFYFIFALGAASAFAEPPVPIWRGAEGSTFQAWTFSDGNDTPLPDIVNNQYGNPLLHVDTDHDWYDLPPDSSQGVQGVWALSGEIDLVIPNNPQPNPFKEIWINVVWKPEKDFQGGPLQNPFLPDEPLVAVTPFEYMDIVKDFEEVDQNGWYHTLYIATIWPNPPKEFISLKGNILVDELSIETICVPEPATIALLSLSSLCALRARRRNR
jgi:hypothetical protein